MGAVDVGGGLRRTLKMVPMPLMGIPLSLDRRNQRADQRQQDQGRTDHKKQNQRSAQDQASSRWRVKSSRRDPALTILLGRRFRRLHPATQPPALRMRWKSRPQPSAKACWSENRPKTTNKPPLRR
jgi:hypothetical protein